MSRSTNTQKSERLNAAHRLLTRGTGMAEAATALSRVFGISLRQAYRYLEEAQTIGHPVPIAEPSVPITFKVPGDVVRQLRAYSAASSLTLSEIVTRAIKSFLAAARGHG
jgi:predicted DNA-binding transcriptional regulator YafY